VSYLGNYFLYQYLLEKDMFENDKKIHEMTDEDWKNKLTQEQYEVCRNKGTEIPFSGKYYYSKDKGITNVFAVEMNYSNQIQSLIQVQVGQVSMHH
jgi:hypothetical protein